MTDACNMVQQDMNITDCMNAKRTNGRLKLPGDASN